MTLLLYFFDLISFYKIGQKCKKIHLFFGSNENFEVFFQNLLTFIYFLFSGCGIWQYTCGSGDCIAGYDVCDGIPQCADSSDESLENCPSKVA